MTFDLARHVDLRAAACPSVVVVQLHQVVVDRAQLAHHLRDILLVGQSDVHVILAVSRVRVKAPGRDLVVRSAYLGHVSQRFQRYRPYGKAALRTELRHGH